MGDIKRSTCPKCGSSVKIKKHGSALYVSHCNRYWVTGEHLDLKIEDSMINFIAEKIANKRLETFDFGGQGNT